VVDDRHYEVCATFDRPSDDQPAINRLPFWSHAAGHECFTIEPVETPRR
jgi:hypothetical protein